MCHYAIIAICCHIISMSYLITISMSYLTITMSYHIITTEVILYIFLLLASH